MRTVGGERAERNERKETKERKERKRRRNSGAFSFYSTGGRGDQLLSVSEGSILTRTRWSRTPWGAILASSNGWSRPSKAQANSLSPATIFTTSPCLTLTNLVPGATTIVRSAAEAFAGSP